MRKITQESVQHFMYNTNKAWKKANMAVEIVGDYVYMSLHGNNIARRKVGTLSIEITDAGWQTKTTKERLNGLPGVSICQKNWVWFLNGKSLENNYTPKNYGSVLRWTKVSTGEAVY